MNVERNPVEPKWITEIEDRHKPVSPLGDIAGFYRAVSASHQVRSELRQDYTGLITIDVFGYVLADAESFANVARTVDDGSMAASFRQMAKEIPLTDEERQR